MHESNLHLRAIVDVCVLVSVDRSLFAALHCIWVFHTCRRELGSLAAFVVVSLCHHNRLSGSVSGSWANMSSLEFFDLGISHLYYTCFHCAWIAIQGKTSFLALFQLRLALGLSFISFPSMGT